MEKQLNQLAKIEALRRFLLGQLDGLSPAQFNRVPAGFNNNIIWHLGHLVSAVQAICYGRAGLPMPLDERYITPFLPGTKPGLYLDEAEIEHIKEVGVASLNVLRADLARGLFTSYAPSERIAAVYGVEVASLADALDFLLFHEGYHVGYVVALKHLVAAL